MTFAFTVCISDNADIKSIFKKMFPPMPSAFLLAFLEIPSINSKGGQSQNQQVHAHEAAILCHFKFFITWTNAFCPFSKHGRKFDVKTTVS